jgi:hypothetical protein
LHIAAAADDDQRTLVMDKAVAAVAEMIAVAGQ